MAFAIYYFKDKTVEVGKIWDDQQQCPEVITQCPDLEEEDRWMEITWDMKGRKKSDAPAFFPAKVLMVGGKLLILLLSSLIALFSKWGLDIYIYSLYEKAHGQFCHYRKHLTRVFLYLGLTPVDCK